MRNFVRLLRFLSWMFAAGLAAGIVIASSFYLFLSPNLPDVEQLRSVQLQTPLRIYTRDQQLLGEFGEKRRTPVSYNQIPTNLVNAFLAAEDSAFFEHQGVNVKSLARASLQLASTGRIQSGGSTITMQVAKNFFLSQERTFDRKFNEILLALKIERELGKPEILELYLNKIYLGNRAYGIEAAANAYYGKSIKELTLAQAAMIAGLPKAPSKYNPIASPDRALIRRNWILGRMQELGMITSEQQAEARKAPVTASYHGAQPEADAPYVAEMARQEIVNRFGVDAYTDGYNVILTIDSKLQKEADAALKRGLVEYSERHGYKGPAGHIDAPEGDDALNIVAERLKEFPSIGELKPAWVVAVTEKKATLLMSSGDTATLLWEGMAWARKYIRVNERGGSPKKAEDIFKQGDVIYVKPHDDKLFLSQIPNVQGAVVSLAPEDGAILALTGGFDFFLSKFNRATQALRQPGSNFKPFVYLAALENGATASTTINDAPVVFEDANLEDSWRPQNSSLNFNGPMRLRKALYQSRNLVSIRLLQKIGIDTTVNFLSQAGFEESRIPRNLSLALGSVEYTPMNVVSGYAAIANGGYKVSPYLIDKVIDYNGKVVYQSNPAVACSKCDNNRKTASSNDQHQANIAPPIADPRSVYILNSILQDVIKRGTGTKALSLGRNDLAGKTGTTNDQVDAWFSGYNANIATTVWVGFDQPSTLGRREYGSRAALPIWIDFMEEALKDMPEAQLKQPPGIVTVKIDPDTGERAAPGQENAIFEMFKAETVPQVVRQDSPTYDGGSSGSSDTPLMEMIFN
ncbi:PBP1A family penicillin-binding protein [Hahella sp. KA22]|uniref:penicillin-binding protein 1A n=1 Tax=Hahella sp. KA22 TaxID=1628392 RepID=UPI000FDE085F|nr:penicillin-binding protein 1A [Hahella sp. KA22]AZZ94401.1 penicillin-binding protein 1A [Hahella sp. KA22]QAY57775.1 PBP1A family penicillin-binding protein [Hahella sp. KA22]